MDQALANRPYEVAGAKKHQRRLQPHRPLRGFKATASSCDDSQTAHATHSTPSPPHSRQDHETPTSPQTPDNKLHHRHAKIFKSPLRQTPPIVDQHSASYSSSNPTLPCRFPCRGSLPRTPPPACRHAHTPYVAHEFEQHPAEGALHRRAPLCRRWSSTIVTLPRDSDSRKTWTVSADIDVPSGTRKSSQGTRPTLPATQRGGCPSE